MIYTIKNNEIKISVDSVGAELKSITGLKKNTEFLWNSNPKYWHSSSPILFPIIGELWNGETIINNKKYFMKRHGVLRDTEFQLIKKDKNKLIFQYRYNEETLKEYPFKFIFQVIYEIKNCKLNIHLKVENIDKINMKFNIGTHPAFMCPINKNYNIEDYKLVFNEKENFEISHLDKNGYYPLSKEKLTSKTNVINLSKDKFINGAVILDNLKSDSVILKSDKADEKIKINFKNFTNIALWRSMRDAPFICIEPWYGHSDYIEFNGNFNEKENLISVKSGNEFKCMYSIEILEEDI